MLTSSLLLLAACGGGGEPAADKGAAPEIAFSAPLPGDILDVGDTLALRLTVSDAESPPDALTLAWTGEFGGLTPPAAARIDGTVAFDVPMDASGPLTYTVSATDPEGNATEASVDVRVNAPPGVPEVALLPEVPTVGSALTASLANAPTDPDGDPLTFSWSWTLDGRLVTDLTGPSVPADRVLRGQTWTVSATVSDGRVASSSTPVSVVVVNTPPVVSDAFLDPAVPNALDDLTVTYAAADADGDDVDVRITWYRDDVEAATGVPTLPASRTERGQAWRAVLVPYDGFEEGTPVEVGPVTIVNRPPVLAAVSLAPSVVYERDTLRCTAGAASDPDGDAVTVRFVWAVNGVEVPGETTTSLSAAHFAHGDVVTCAGTPSDGDLEGAAVASAPLTVSNTAPEVLSVSVSPTSPVAGDTLTCAWLASDDDGDADLAEVSWALDGVTVGTGPTYTGAFVRNQQLTCTVTPFDGTERGVPVSASVRVGDTAPSIVSAVISPAAPSANDTLTCATTGYTDIDGDANASRFTWSVGGTTLGTGPTLASGFHARDTVTCTAVASDGILDGNTVSSSVTVTNAPPTVSSLTLTPASAYTNDTLTARALGADADGDSVTLRYAWTVNGTAAGGTGATLPGTAFGRGDTVRVVVTPNDGYLDGAASSASVTILNSLPTLGAASLSTASPAEGVDDLVCTLASAPADTDGDTLTTSITWMVDGAAWTGSVGRTTRTGDTIRAADLVDGQRWSCTVSVSDGAGGLVSATSGTAEVVPNGLCWSTLWSHTLTSQPSASVALTASGTAQSVQTVGSRSCWKQESGDGNALFIPVTRFTRRYVAVAADVYWPGSAPRTFSFHPFGNRIGTTADVQSSNWWQTEATGSTWKKGSTTSATNVASALAIPTASAWHTLRVEIDTTTGSASWLVDGVTRITRTLTAADWAGTNVVLRASANASTAANVCWSNVVVEQANGARCTP